MHFTKLFSHFLDDNNGGEYYANIISYTLSMSTSIACPVIRPGMVQAWVAKKLVNVTFYEFLSCPFYALGPRFHENRNILEVVHYNDKLVLATPYHISFPVHSPSPWLSIDMSYPE